MKQVFWQSWRDLLFVHWEIEPASVARLLPSELEPELFDGKAYVGLIPFRMTDIRHVLLPAIPGFSATLETNVRTYVKRKDVAREPIPAVWFFSLDASSALAVIAARLGFGLPYFKARMAFHKRHASGGKIHLSACSKRRWPQPSPAYSLVEAEFSDSAALLSAQPGTLEHFLIERYALYTRHRGILKYARVAHDPYRITSGSLIRIGTELLSAAALPPPAPQQEALVHRAADVTVRIGSLESITGPRYSMR
jgi:uncharacterized protein YqjF (DUF2071 family)